MCLQGLAVEVVVVAVVPLLELMSGEGKEEEEEAVRCHSSRAVVCIDKVTVLHREV